ncbi:MAG: VTT domain-containing protein [Vicinamibacterales bacterium]|nr:VTT domain-containing protein [Vicinamibacterales bacterium]
MRQLVSWAQTLGLTLGGPGLFLVAVVDSSVLSMPELVDVLVVLMTIQHKSLVVYYAAMGTAGSVVGALGVHYLGQKGGEALLRRRFSEERVVRTMAYFRRWGVATILVPAMLPPPTPFKLLCLAAGATGMTRTAFALATGAGRGIRYFAEGMLAYYLGDLALEYLDQHGTTVAWWLLGLSAAAAMAYYWRHQRHQRQRAAI